jgi:large-conductance mechanosensitive channel
VTGDRSDSEQNWLAVFIDFVIVVIGVFIGIQVANWNDERLNRREGRLPDSAQPTAAMR